MPATLTRGLTSSMITGTMLSASVVSRSGLAASRNRMVAYWFWSAMQKRTGSGDVTNGSQNCFKIEGRDTRQTVAAVIATSANTASANANLLSRMKLRIERGGTGTVEAEWTLVVSEPLLGNSGAVPGKPVGCPGQENCGA